MLGKQHITIDASDFIKGVSSSAELADGGFSPETSAVNLIAIPGVLYAPAAMTDKSTNLSGEAIAWCPAQAGSQLNGYILSNNGTIHSISTSQVLTASSALGGTYTVGKSDIVQFLDKIYATSTTDVARMNTDLSAGDEDWWSATQSEGVLTSGVPHPLCIFQDRMWIGDLNALHRFDGSSSDQDVLLLTSHHVITALGVDPSSGKMLIATTQDTVAGNYSASLAVNNSVFVYDGTSATYSREYLVDGIVTAFHTVGGVTYVFYGGDKIGYWNGAGITFLRKLRSVTIGTGSELPYKHHVTHIDNTLYVVDGLRILAFGDVLPGRKVWYYAASNPLNANKLGLICPVGNKLLGVGFPTAKFYTFDTVSIASNPSFAFYSNRYLFPRPVHIRHISIEYVDAVANGEDNRVLYYIDQTTTSATQLARKQQTSIQNSSGGAVLEIDDIVGVDKKVTMFQLIYTSTTNNYGVRRFIIYYDPAE
jgi:hypothetical protein